MPSRRLIVNADDFGQSRAVNDGVIRAHEHGIVTSASLMVRSSSAVDAAGYARTHAGLSVGLHIDLCEWKYEHGGWTPIYLVVPLDDRQSVSAELRHQLREFERLVGRPPTHLDSHQHFHMREPALSAVEQIGAELGVPIRGRSAHVQYSGAFYGQTAEGAPYPEGITVDHLLRVLADLDDGCIELGCHPAVTADFDTMYGQERVVELQVLCDPRVRAGIRALGIELCSFHDLGLTSTGEPWRVH